MNKKILTGMLVIMLFGTLFVLSGCVNNSDKEENKVDNNVVSEQTEETNEKQESVDDLYFKVLNNEIKYINENNEETLFSEYMENYKDSSTDTSVKYTIFDFDNDSENEMIVMIDSNSDGFYLILNNENEIIYGFDDVYRGMISIKTDGSYNASGGAYTGGILKSTFKKNERITETLAEMDMGKYKIDGKSVSESEYLKYFEEFENKENVEFITYIEKYSFNTENSDESSSTASSDEYSNTANTKNITQSSFKEGVYRMTKPSLIGTDAEGYDTTITFSNGKVSFLESYWETKKFGTYSIQGDTLTIKYTSGNEVDSINGDTGTVSLNETEVYKIDGNKITMQSTTADSYYKAGSTVYELK